MIIRRSKILKWLVAAVLFTMPLQWIVLAHAGALGLKPVHFCLMALTVLSPVLIPRSTWAICLSGHTGKFIVAFLFLCLTTLASIIWADDQLAGIVNVAKSGIYFFFFIVLTSTFAELSKRGRIAETIVIGVLLGTFGYLAYNVFLFHQLGSNFLEEYLLAISAADVQRLKSWFFQKLFNCSFSGVCLSITEDQEALKSSLKNTILGSQVTYVVFVGMIANLANRKARRIALQIAVGTCIILVLTSMSRANTLALVIVLFFGAFVPSMKGAKKPGAIRLVIAACALTGSVIWSLDSEMSQGLIRSLNERMEESAADPRLAMFDNAFQEIAAAPIFGHGAGKKVMDGQGIRYPVHNVFLATWVEQGLVGLAFAVAWYGILLATVLHAYFSNWSWTEDLHVKWVALLPVVALLRSLVSGGGEMTLVDWMGLAVFFGLVSSRARSTNNLARNASPPARHPQLNSKSPRAVLGESYER